MPHLVRKNNPLAYLTAGILVILVVAFVVADFYIEKHFRHTGKGSIPAFIELFTFYPPIILALALLLLLLYRSPTYHALCLCSIAYCFLSFLIEDLLFRINSGRYLSIAIMLRDIVDTLISPNVTLLAKLELIPFFCNFTLFIIYIIFIVSKNRDKKIIGGAPF